ncbi:uncharacterized protein LOC112886970 isoform X4 [Panicum hallii]|uniref:uncharacterized protein LOC112886970 isoform X4 n=1 Tax=Panicum hallii TaxID=206008 RepID=UPI000DF4D3FE|nr:uncharacterized protein LOC112886970 isoform X4 [Panicum hallii]
MGEVALRGGDRLDPAIARQANPLGAAAMRKGAFSASPSVVTPFAAPPQRHIVGEHPAAKSCAAGASFGGTTNSVANLLHGSRIMFGPPMALPSAFISGVPHIPTPLPPGPMLFQNSPVPAAYCGGYFQSLPHGFQAAAPAVAATQSGGCRAEISSSAGPAGGAIAETSSSAGSRGLSGNVSRNHLAPGSRRIGSAAACTSRFFALGKIYPVLPPRELQNDSDTPATWLFPREEGAFSWGDLPLDVFGQVLRLLPSGDEHLRLSLVHHDWHASVRQQHRRQPPAVAYLALPNGRVFRQLYGVLSSRPRGAANTVRRLLLMVTQSVSLVLLS